MARSCKRLWRRISTRNRRKLDLWTGIITSTFVYAGVQVSVEVACSQDSDVIAVSVDSLLVSQGKLGIFLDFPWNDGSSKFSAPFVGNYSVPEMHTTTLNVASAKYSRSISSAS